MIRRAGALGSSAAFAVPLLVNDSESEVTTALPVEDFSSLRLTEIGHEVISAYHSSPDVGSLGSILDAQVIADPARNRQVMQRAVAILQNNSARVAISESRQFKSMLRLCEASEVENFVKIGIDGAGSGSQSSSADFSFFKLIPPAEFECAICLGLMVSAHNLPCGHSFCAPCINKLSSKNCPSCREPFHGASPVRALDAQIAQYVGVQLRRHCGGASEGFNEDQSKVDAQEWYSRSIAWRKEGSKVDLAAPLKAAAAVVVAVAAVELRGRSESLDEDVSGGSEQPRIPEGTSRERRPSYLDDGSDSDVRLDGEVQDRGEGDDGEGGENEYDTDDAVVSAVAAVVAAMILVVVVLRKMYFKF